MENEFNNLPWHDAELKEIIIDRELKDRVVVRLRWPEEYGGKDVSVYFEKSYGLIAHMHFGFFPPDSILEAECITDSLELSDMKKNWAAMGLDLSRLCCYRIVTNSTNSTIDIFALGFEIREA